MNYTGKAGVCAAWLWRIRQSCKFQFIELSEARERPVDERPSQEPFDAAADFLHVGTAVERGNTEEAFAMCPEAGARGYDH